MSGWMVRDVIAAKRRNEMRVVPMSKHSPGPWKATGSGRDKSPITIRCRRGGEVATLKGVTASFSVGPAERTENAFLIAAAPEMLATLKLVASHTGCVVTCLPEMRCEDCDIQREAASAIAKAEGRS